MCHPSALVMFLYRRLFVLSAVDSISLSLYLSLHWVFLAVLGFSLVVVSRGYSLGVVCGLLTVAASLVAEHKL